jgi:hypothetical protein
MDSQLRTQIVDKIVAACEEQTSMGKTVGGSVWGVRLDAPRYKSIDTPMSILSTILIDHAVLPYESAAAVLKVSIARVQGIAMGEAGKPEHFRSSFSTSEERADYAAGLEIGAEIRRRLNTR